VEIDVILKKALSKAEEAEVYAEEFQNTNVIFQSNRPKSVESCLGQGVGLRVIKNGRIGFSSITNKEDVDFLVEAAVESARFGETALFEFPPPSTPSQVKCFDPEVIKVTPEQMIEEGKEAIDKILQEFPSFKCEAEIDRTVAQVFILNSQGLNFTYKKTYYSFSLYAFLAEEGNFLGIGEEEVGCKYRKLSDVLSREIIEKIKISLRKATMDTGSYPVIFTPKAMPLIFAPLKKGINGKLVYKKASPLFSKLKTRIVSPMITIIDDATYPFGIGSRKVDAEGVPSRKNILVKNGILESFIFDLRTAKLMQTETTANAAREYDSLPTPSTTNFIVEPGELSLEDAIKDIKEGLIIDQVIGAGQSNVLMGEFSVNLDLGFKIENGKIKGRVKDAMATGNAYHLLNNIVGIGRESRWIGSTFTPFFYFSKINITG